MESDDGEYFGSRRKRMCLAKEPEYVSDVVTTINKSGYIKVGCLAQFPLASTVTCNSWGWGRGWDMNSE